MEDRESALRDDLKNLDEKIRSIITAMSFLFAGSVAVFYTASLAGQGKASPASPASLTWEGYGYRVDHVFIILVGFALFMALSWALLALDPAAGRPAFVVERDRFSDDLATLLRYKERRFRECQAFLALAMAVLPLLAIARIPITDAGTRTDLILGAALLALWTPFIPWGHAIGRALATAGTRGRTLVALLPVALATTYLAFAFAYDRVRWSALLYALLLVVLIRILQTRSATAALIGTMGAVLLFGLGLGLDLAF